MKDAAMLVAYTVVDGQAEWVPFDWAGHVESSDCPCGPIFDREYRIHRSFSDPDIQSPAYTETADEPGEDRNMRTTDSEKVDQIRKIVNDSNPALEEALRELIQWVPQDGHYPLKVVSEIVNGEGMYFGHRGELLTDEQCPLATEAFSYCLFGKEDARTYLSLLRQIVEAAGYTRSQMSTWADEAVDRGIENRKAEVARQVRVAANRELRKNR